MSFIYTRADLKAKINKLIQNKMGMLVDFNDTCNDAVRQTLNDIDLRSTRRKNSLVPNLFNGEYDYACPTDLKGQAIIDIPQQAKREDGEFSFVPSREFAINGQRGDISIDDFNGQRILKINSKVQDKTLVLSELDSLSSGGGTWTAIGNGTDLEADADDYVHGNGALKMSITEDPGTFAGMQNIALNQFDFTDYLNGNGAIFVWVKINSTTGLTNYILKIGTDASNYYQKTVTTQNDGTALVAGWNLLRFDMTSLTTVGTPTLTNFKYIALYFTKLSSKISESNYKFDYIVAKVGKNADVKYYSKYGWQTSAGAYLENSTEDTDVLVADSDELDLIIAKGVEIATEELILTSGGKTSETKTSAAEGKYTKLKKTYEMNNPSERPIMMTTYYNY